MDTEKYTRKLILVLMGSSVDWVAACGYRLSLMKLVVTPEHETMAVDGRSLFVNPTWPHTRPDIANLFTLVHEALHCWFRHPERLRKWQGPRELIHMAADYAINLMAVQQGCPYPMPDDGLYDTRFVDDNGKALSAELIAHILQQEQQQQEQEQQPEGQPGGQPGGQTGETDDDSDDNGQGSGQDSGESISPSTRVRQSGKGCSCVSGYSAPLD